ncbi:MAG: nucleotidyltransferase domain-containing protein [Deltaproteobacteria bacterium]|nr:nucleotidyltransferase domain-containing protein [Deltaproteobacteria bacterium]
MTNFGLPQEMVHKIHSVFSQAKKIKRVRVFGSRALGHYREGSDIDLAVDAHDLNLDDILTLRLQLEDILFPYRIDLVDVARIDEKELRAHIERVGKVIYEIG